MKHNAFRWIPAVLLAALLAGCGAETAASARPAGSRELKSTPPDSMHATAAITEQYTLEKVVQAENGGKGRHAVLPSFRLPGGSSTNTMCRSTPTARRQPTRTCGTSALR